MIIICINIGVNLRLDRDGGQAMDLETRLQQLIDRTDIMERKHAYLRAADACDPDRMVAGFLEDFTASYNPADRPIEGRQAIRAWYAARLSHVIASSHHVSNFEITFDDMNTAQLRCYLYSWQRFDDYPATADRHRFARYIDGWARRDGEWWQSSLVCLVAGEYCSDAVPRIGEYLGAGF
jgi:hypothetical protein